MVRMRLENGPVLLSLKTQEKAMGKALVQVLRAIVHTPFITVYLRDFALQVAKSLFNFLDFFRTGTFLKLKKYHMAQQAFLRLRCNGWGSCWVCGVFAGHKEKGAQGKQGKEFESVFHHIIFGKI